MNKYTITDTLAYIEYDTDLLMFDALEEFLQNGYTLENSIYICPVVSKNGQKIILSTLHIENPDANIENEITEKYEACELVYPDFSDTILNIIGGIRKQYQAPTKYIDKHNTVDRKYKNMIILLLDGLGVNILKENLGEDSFLGRHMEYIHHAIYPSTTAASTTATISGLTPLESGWTGWQNYIRELNKGIVLFNGNDYFTDEPTGRTGYEFMPWEPFYKDLDCVGAIVQPDFSKEDKDISDVFKKSLSLLHKDKYNVQYVYFTEPDSLMHEFGPNHPKVKEKLIEIDNKLKAYYEALPKDTLLVVTADHGHIGIENSIDFYECKTIYKYLNRKPSNDSRCLTFSVKKEFHKEFEDTFLKLYGNIYMLFKSKDAIEKGFFGDPKGFIHERIGDFLGDYVALATNRSYLNYAGPKDFIFKSHHAGITKEEMEVPLIVLRK